MLLSEVTDYAQKRQRNYRTGKYRAHPPCMQNLPRGDVVPLNFGYTWDDDGLTLYFHSGLKGKKIDALRADPRVCFELDTEQGVTGEGDIACRYSFAFSSIVGYGSMEFAKTPDEKRKGFDVIMQHQTGRSGFTYNDASLSVAEVFHVRADSFEASRKALRPRKPE